MGSGNTERFGQWLDLTLMNRGLSGREVARALKVTDGAVSKWRQGVSVPHMDTIVRLARYLDITPPLRLAVTAGLIDGALVELEPLPSPEPTRHRQATRERIERIPFLSEAERQHMLDSYDNFWEEETTKT